MPHDLPDMSAIPLSAATPTTTLLSQKSATHASPNPLAGKRATPLPTGPGAKSVTASAAAEAASTAALLAHTSATATTVTEAPKSMHTPTTLYTRLHGKWYDMREFKARHPGGPFALSMAAGRDGTALWESYHPFTTRAKMDSILKRYEVPEDVAARLRTIEEETPGMPRVDNLFDWPAGGSEFANDLKREVRAYFEGEAERRGVSFKEATKGTPGRFAFQLSIAASLLISGYFLTFHASKVAMITSPVLAWTLAVNVFHDATHFALTLNPAGNFYTSYLFPYFESPSTWALEHIIGHHAYPNIAGLDPDVAHTAHARRDHPDLKWADAHEQQGRWFRLLPHFILATTFGLNIANEVESTIAGNYNGAVPMGPRTMTRHVMHLAGRLATVVGILGWPFAMLSAEQASLPAKFMFALVPTFIFSTLFMLNTQVNHLTPHNISATSRDWYKHQIVTAQNFGTNVFHFVMSGGLNHQLEHHLFPGINHVHLPALQPKIIAVCKKHNVPYTHASGYIEAVRNYLTHTDNMAEKPKAQ
ncbi:fatty acid desaturase-domain-containing protein [Blastocladiella britannica]|nr:fatty acid desaturase-domain-containing protein [Blastocladiella britannica]